MLRHGVPDADLSSGREGDELRPDEEEAVHHGPKVEGANVHAHAVLQYQCTLYGYGRDLSSQLPLTFRAKSITISWMT